MSEVTVNGIPLDQAVFTDPSAEEEASARHGYRHARHTHRPPPGVSISHAGGSAVFGNVRTQIGRRPLLGIVIGTRHR